MADQSSENSNKISDSPSQTIKGVEVISQLVKRLPNRPGVYRMLGEDGDVLYVGKARSLKKRVTSYTRLQGQSNRIIRMVQLTTAMEFVTTRTETEALLLEANLIKRLRPKFNVLLRDDKSFPYILLTKEHDAPALLKHRGARKQKGDYFGPFASAISVDRTINALQRAFLLRNCSDSYYSNRSRPCLQYQIKRCAAPCTQEISLEDYAKLVSDAKRFLMGKSTDIKTNLVKAMELAAESLDYEQAAKYRDRLEALSHIQSRQGINPQTVTEADVFAIYQEGGLNCIQVFFFRTGHNWGNRAYFPKADKSFEKSDVLQSFLAQFYDDKQVPKQILLSHEIMERELLTMALSEKIGKKVVITVPSRGEKRDLTEHALANAQNSLQQRLAESATQIQLLENVKTAFNLSNRPRRIEVYDNSHIMGTYAVGGMIVAGIDGFVKNQYRKFNIKSADLVPGDDFGMMREVFKRRFSRLLREDVKQAESKSTPTTAKEEDSNDTEIPQWPDLVLIDGGRGQLNAARKTLEKLGIIDIPLVGVAKGPERNAGREKFYIPNQKSFILPERDPVLYFVQRLRDEAHRFAIGTHRARRKKDMSANPLDEIVGIGPTRKRALLRHFGTAKAVAQAGINDLRGVSGISEATAQLIFDHFHENS